MLIYDIRSHLGRTSSEDEDSPEGLIDDLKAYGIPKVGISGLSGISARVQDDLIHRTMETFPEVVKRYAFTSPKTPDAIDEANHCLGGYGVGGVKFHSWKHGCYPDNTPTLNDIFTEIRKYGVHVQAHMGATPFSTLCTWAEYTRKFPNINFLFTHISHYEFELSAVETMKDLRNVWAETSGQMDVGMLLKAIDVLGPERVCFGTDWPYKPVNIEIEKSYELKIPGEKPEYIFHKNAERLWSHSPRCL